MARIRWFIGIMIAGLLMSAIGATSIFAAEFETSKETGTIESHGGVWNTSTKTYGGAAAEEQIFTVEYETKKTMSVECKGVTDKGILAKLKATTQVVTAVYTGCEVAGDSANNIEAEYEFNAGSDTKSPWEGTIAIKKKITISSKTAGICTVTVEPQGPLNVIKYIEVTGPEGNTALEIEAKVTGIEWSAEGSLASCNKTGSKIGTGKAGAYKGNSTSWLVGGTLKMG